MIPIRHAGRVRHLIPLLVVTLAALCGTALAQTNPTPQPLPYTQDFSTLPPSSPVYPAGWQGWSIGTAGPAFSTAGPTSDQPLTANGLANSTAGNAYNYNGKIGYLNTSTSGTGDRTVALAIDGTGRTAIVVQYDIMTIRNSQDGGSNTRINEVTLQYRTTVSGPWISLTGIEYQNLGGIPNNQTGAVTTPQNLQTKVAPLPPACDNQPVIQLRWASRQVSGAGNRPSFAVDNLFINGATGSTHTISASADAGLAIAPSGAVSVNDGANQTFTITPSDGCHGIADVIVDGSSVGAVASYTFSSVTGDHSIHAIAIVLGPYTISSSASAGGSISPSGGTLVACGASQSYAMTANLCNVLVDVIVDGSSVGAVASYTFTNAHANHSITANFGLAPGFSIVASAGTGGSITPAGSVSVPCGGGQSFTIAANACHHIADVLVDGSSVGPVASYAFSGVQANHTLAASFALNQYTIVATAGPHGSISPSGNVTVDCGANQHFHFTPDSGYVVKDVVVDGDPLPPVTDYDFTDVIDDGTITVDFKIPLLAPAYDPNAWNDLGGDDDNGEFDNNCYNYAANQKNGTFAQPGAASHVSPVSFDCDGISAVAQLDGLTPSTKDAVCDNGYKVALVFGQVEGPEGPVDDFHWYRQDATGLWSHKPGHTEATNNDDADHAITDPETADRGTLDDGVTKQYEHFCGYFCITKGTVVAGDPSIVSGLADLMGARVTTGNRPLRSTPAIASNQAAATPLVFSGRRDTTVAFTAQADLDSLVDMLTGLPDASDPGWPNLLGYRGMHLKMDNVGNVYGSSRVRVWKGVICVVQNGVRHCFIDAKHLERWLHRRCFRHSLLAVPGGDRLASVGLAPARPNPFGSTTSIPFAIASPAKVALKIYDLTGRTVRVLVDTELGAGAHQVTWDGRDAGGAAVHSGTYFYKLTVNGRLAGSAKTVFIGH